MSDTPQKRRREDNPRGRRPAHERAILAVLGAAAFAAASWGGWWLWSQSGVGAVVRDGSPNWAPDGRVIFSSEVEGRKADLYLAERSGGNRVPVTTMAGDEGGAAYSLDGRSLAYHSDFQGNFEIYVQPVGTESWKNLTHNPAMDQSPAWSRDGRQIVFVSDRDNPDFDVYRMNADGSDVERLTHGGSNRFPQYSPDGGQLALHIGRDVYIMSLSTKGLRRLTYEPDNGMYPTWAPDGLHLAFMSWRNGHSQIFTARPDGTEPRVIVTMPNGDAVDPRWSADGRYIAFVHVPDSGITSAPTARPQRIVYVVELETGRLSRVSR